MTGTNTDKEQRQKEYEKEYRIKNKERIAEHKAEYRTKNKEQIAEKRNAKITCKCGCIIANSSISRHMKTKKHINLIK